MEFILPKRFGASGHVLKQISATPGSTGGWLDLSRHYWRQSFGSQMCRGWGDRGRSHYWNITSLVRNRLKEGGGCAAAVSN